MTHIFTLTFANSAARDAYLIHPDHIWFVNYIGEMNHIEAMMVLDYVPLK